jgi:prepilin-type N-terminal cleavage/methylation domain-containing protein
MKWTAPKPTSKRVQHAFTLVELLVVIAIIAIIASLLLPALATAKERSNRTVCRNNVRQWCLGLLLYAEDNDEAFPKAHPSGSGNVNPYWMDVKFRDLMNVKYRVPRAQFYCPSNKKWNRDDFWKWPSSDEAVMGYFYLAGEPDFELNPALLRMTDQKPILPKKTSDTFCFRI